MTETDFGKHISCPPGLCSLLYFLCCPLADLTGIQSLREPDRPWGQALGAVKWIIGGQRKYLREGPGASKHGMQKRKTDPCPVIDTAPLWDTSLVRCVLFLIRLLGCSSMETVCQKVGFISRGREPPAQPTLFRDRKYNQQERMIQLLLSI